jgi:hypothetical protein
VARHVYDSHGFGLKRGNHLTGRYCGTCTFPEELEDHDGLGVGDEDREEGNLYSARAHFGWGIEGG